MPRRRTRHPSADEPGVAANESLPTPYLARLPLVQPALIYCFHNHLSINHRHYLLRKIVKEKRDHNLAAHQRQSVVTNLIKQLERHASLKKAFALRSTLGEHARQNTETPLLVCQKPASQPLLITLLTLILVNDAAVIAGVINESWWIGLKYPKNASIGMEPSSPFAFFMLAITLLAFYDTAASDAECQNNIDVQASLERLTAELASLTFYRENELRAIEARCGNSKPLDDTTLSSLLTQVCSLKKEPRRESQNQNYATLR